MNTIVVIPGGQVQWITQAYLCYFYSFNGHVWTRWHQLISTLPHATFKVDRRQRLILQAEEESNQDGNHSQKTNPDAPGKFSE